MNIEYSGSLFYTEVIIRNRIAKLKQYACPVLLIVFIKMVTLLIVFLDVFNIFRFGPEKNYIQKNFAVSYKGWNKKDVCWSRKTTTFRQQCLQTTKIRLIQKPDRKI